MFASCLPAAWSPWVLAGSLERVVPLFSSSLLGIQARHVPSTTNLEKSLFSFPHRSPFISIFLMKVVRSFDDTKMCFLIGKSLQATFAEIPGVLETGTIRKIDRRYPFNDACQVLSQKYHNL